MSKQKNPYPLRIDDIVMNKIKETANIYGRSINKEIEFALKQYIASYEQAHGEIKLPEEAL